MPIVFLCVGMAGFCRKMMRVSFAAAIFFLRKHLSHLMLYKCKIGLKVCYY